MEPSIFLARMIGIMALLIGASMAVRRNMLMSIFHDVARNRTLSYILGVLMAIIGLFIVLSHRVFYSGFPLLITVIGWGILVEGVSYLFVSEEFLERYMATLNNRKVYYLIALAYLVIGGYLTYAGFFNHSIPRSSAAGQLIFYRS